MKEELKYRKICLYCGDKFLSYRSSAKFDSPKCRKQFNLEHSEVAQAGKKLAWKRYYLKYKSKLSARRNLNKRLARRRDSSCAQK